MINLSEVLGPEMDVHARFLNGDTPLHLAAIHPDCNVGVISKLLAMGASLNIENKSGQTPLHCFVQRKHSLDIIKLVLDNGAFVNARDDFYYSPLHYALLDFECNPNVVRLLLERGSDVHAQNEDEEQPLHLAATVCNLDIISLILEYGADVNALDIYYQSPLHHALNSYKCHPSVVKLLLEKGANILQRNECAQQPLHVAAYKCGADIVKLLLESGADVNSLDDDMQSPLNHALNALHCDSEVVKALLEAGADIQSPNENGEHILHFVVYRCKLDIVKLILDYGASINALDTYNRSPLHVALNSTECDPGVIQLLVNEGANIGLKDHMGQQPLHLAASHWDSGTIELLLDHGASADVINFLGCTPLFYAIFHQQDDYTLAVLKLLLQSGAHVYRGLSPLNVVIDMLNKEDIRASTEKFSKYLQWTKLLLKCSLLERPMLDFKTICVDFQTAVYLLNYGKGCLIELRSNCIGLGSNLAQFIVQQRGKEHRDVEKILHVLSKTSCSIYKEVIARLLTKRQLKEKLEEQIEAIGRNKSSLKLNYECLCRIIHYLCNRDDLLNLALAFHTCC